MIFPVYNFYPDGFSGDTDQQKQNVLDHKMGWSAILIICNLAAKELILKLTICSSQLAALNTCFVLMYVISITSNQFVSHAAPLPQRQLSKSGQHLRGCSPGSRAGKYVSSGSSRESQGDGESINYHSHSLNVNRTVSHCYWWFCCQLIYTLELKVSNTLQILQMIKSHKYILKNAAPFLKTFFINHKITAALSQTQYEETVCKYLDLLEEVLPLIQEAFFRSDVNMQVANMGLYGEGKKSRGLSMR